MIQCREHDKFVVSFIEYTDFATWPEIYIRRLPEPWLQLNDPANQRSQTLDLPIESSQGLFKVIGRIDLLVSDGVQFGS